MSSDQSKNDDALFYVLSAIFALWGLCWIVGLLRITS
jgi:hypothetical protein